MAERVYSFGEALAREERANRDMAVAGIGATAITEGAAQGELSSGSLACLWIDEGAVWHFLPGREWSEKSHTEAGREAGYV